MVDKTLIREYLASLKEDGELDYIFVLLLEAMNFRIVVTPKESKGQSQYGKDVIAVGNDSEGVLHKWYFELKGFEDKDINDNVWGKNDGVRNSLLAAKDAIYRNLGMSVFDRLPVKICLVHNGIVKPNFKPQFDGFISQNFNENQFEHWDIYRLTDNFSDYLFSEYLFSNEKHSYLFKRILIFIEILDYEFQDLRLLTDLIFEEYNQKNLKNKIESKRLFKKLFATLELMIVMIWQQAQRNDNLVPIKKAINLIILQTWAFILSRKSEGKPKYQQAFFKLLKLQSEFYSTYFNKTLEVALYRNGLFSSTGFLFESVGYPLRAFEYLDDLLYFFELNDAFENDANQLTQHQLENKVMLMQLIKNNPGCKKPILDSHLIPIHHLVSYFVKSTKKTQKEMTFIRQYICDCFEQIILRKRTTNTFPYHSDDLSDLVYLSVTGTKKERFSDKGSLLIPILLEYLAIFKLKDFYEEIISFFEEHEIDLQIAFPLFEDFPNLEESMFQSSMINEYAVELIYVTTSFTDFCKSLKSVKTEEYDLRTQKEGYDFLITLTQSYYRNEPFPNEWRSWIQ